MAKSVKREVSTRFLEVFDELIANKQVENMKEFCRQLDYLPQSMTQLKGGKRDINIELVVKLFNEFRGNPLYVLLGVGKKILDPNEIPAFTKNLVSLNQASSSDDKAELIKVLEELVQSKNDYIAVLKEENARLKGR